MSVAFGSNTTHEKHPVGSQHPQQPREHKHAPLACLHRRELRLVDVQDPQGIDRRMDGPELAAKYLRAATAVATTRARWMEL
ncbi:hypothetical protein C0Q70_05589 [Pomacea canaliculata]|uniref:Uncharacterized protein n=1 Tax=Pomacea canaliculata TaxID=400727 RepID=A0A2T7PLM0_POMCA|nr:hypothetical protein C0Q70_05589 [Pomacea canaliculata]